MLFARFRKPKWQHADPQVRKQALLLLDPADPEDAGILTRLATEDVAPEVRRSAVKRLSSLDLLRSRIVEDEDAGVREVAAARYRQLLAGGSDTAPLEQRLNEVNKIDDEATLCHLARSGREAELRLAALQRVQTAAVLEEVAVHDPLPKVRQAALARIVDEGALQRLAEALKTRDRKLARQARDHLEGLQRERMAQAQADHERETICSALEGIAQQPTASARGEFLRLKNRWQMVERPAPDALEQRFQEACSRCESALQTASEQNEPDLEPMPEQRDLLAERLAELQREPDLDACGLEALRELLAETEGPDHDAGIRHRLAEHAESLERFQAAEAVLRQALDSLKSVLPDDVAALRAKAAHLEGVLEEVAWRSPLPAPKLVNEARAALEQLTETEQQARQRHAERQAILQQAIEKLQEHLKAGRLKPAQRQLGQIQQLVRDMPEREQQVLKRKLRGLRAQVAELEDWRRFATLPKQEGLCREMEALAANPLAPPEQAKAIKRLQREWKATGGSASPQARELWERFRAAADRAFEPCRAYFDELAQQRGANLDTRRQLADQLDEFIEKADWAALTAQGLAQVRDQARREWLAATPVPDDADAKAVEERFETLMDALTEQLHRKREANAARKAALLEEARELLAAEDVFEATTRAKDLQQQWRDAGQAPPQQERRLWREFRAICDELFQRRDRERAARSAERNERTQQAEALCNEAQSLVDEADVDAALQRWQELDQALRRLRGVSKAYHGRMQEAGDALRRRQRDAQREQSLRALQYLRDAAAVCAELEQSVLEGRAPPSVSEELLARWEREGTAELQSRWERAVAALDAGGFPPAELDENERIRRELCIRLEILAGMESPEEDRQRRMDLQVQRLNEGLAQGLRQESADVAQSLELQWLQAGPAPTEQRNKLEQRFTEALARMRT